MEKRIVTSVQLWRESHEQLKNTVRRNLLHKKNRREEKWKKIETIYTNFGSNNKAYTNNIYTNKVYTNKVYTNKGSNNKGYLTLEIAIKDITHWK